MHLLQCIDFHPGLYRRYKERRVWELTILRKHEVFRFANEIGFSIERKQEKLLTMLKRTWPSKFKEEIAREGLSGRKPL